MKRVAAAAAVAFALVAVTWALLDLRLTYTLTIVTLGAALLGAVAGSVGTFAVLRGESLLGDTVSHAALPGIVGGYLIAGRSLPALFAGAALSGLSGVGAVMAITSTTRLKREAAMGIVLAGWFGIGIVGLTWLQGRPDAGQAGIDAFLFGQAAAIRARDIGTLVAVAALVAVTLVAAWKELKLIVFDREFALVSGLRVGLWEGVLSVVTVIAVVAGLQIAGVILMVGMLVAPAVGARQWTDQLWEMVVLAALFGAASGVAGALISAASPGLATGPLIIVIASAIVAVSLTVAPGRGLIVTALRRRADRRRVAIRTVLRDLYHYAWDHGGERSGVPEAFLVGLRRLDARRGLALLARDGLARRIVAAAPAAPAVRPSRDEYDLGVARWFLTERGVGIARADVRNQRLWDLYRERAAEGSLPLVAEERDRDIRAVVPAELVSNLEALLADGPEEPHVRG